MENITKTFFGGTLVANKDVSFSGSYSHITGIVGENGAGKSTLMSILSGQYKPNKGQIFVEGKNVEISSPLIASNLGIGIVPQHFKLVDNMTVVENIMLGTEITKKGVIDRQVVKNKVVQLSKKYHLEIDPDKKIQDLSVGMKQRVEILKTLFRELKIIIFDEPTSVLTPNEIEEFLKIMKNFKKQGKCVIFISHKLKEIIDSSDDIVVMRKGEVTGSLKAKFATNSKLSKLMVGKSVNLKFDKLKSQKATTKSLIEIKNVSLVKRHVSLLKNINLSVKKGEILSLVGIDGNGHNVLAKLIAKEKFHFKGKINYFFSEKKTKKEKNINEHSSNIFDHKIGYIHENRQDFAVSLDLSFAENMIFNRINHFVNSFGIISKARKNDHSNKIIRKYNVQGAQGGKASFRSLSGGNQQKAVSGREIEFADDLLIAANPTRGVDVGAIKSIYQKIIAKNNKGTTVILLSGELDEILAVSDRIAVFHKGEIMGVFPNGRYSKSKIGLMMTGTPMKNL